MRFPECDQKTHHSQNQKIQQNTPHIYLAGPHRDINKISRRSDYNFKITTITNASLIYIILWDNSKNSPANKKLLKRKKTGRHNNQMGHAVWVLSGYSNGNCGVEYRLFRISESGRQKMRRTSTPCLTTRGSYHHPESQKKRKSFRMNRRLSGWQTQESHARS